MKNELIDFFIKTSADLENVIWESKQVLARKRSKDEKEVILLSIIYENLKEGDDKLEVFMNQLSNHIDENKLSLLANFITEEKMNILEFFTSLKNDKRESYPKLIDLDWKFIALSSPDKFEIGEITPKILLRLFFNNGAHKLIETDLANLKKLLEELDQNLSSLNSTFTRRIDTFLK